VIKRSGIAPIHWHKGEKASTKKYKPRLMDGLPVKDAMNPLMIHIKPCDINGSTKADASNCAAARALKREIGSEAKVFLTRTYVKVGKVWARFMTPESISREITAFDRGAQFESGEYQLNPPSKAERLGGRPKPTGPKKASTNRTAKARHITASVRKMK
jgi:hypothetical protein